MDTIEGIDKVTLLTDIGSIQSSPRVSMHDFDLGYSLKLLKKLGLIDSVKIFGVPMRISKREALRQLCDAHRLQFTLRKWLAQLMQGS